jgi:hypothetical protein
MLTDAARKLEKKKHEYLNVREKTGLLVKWVQQQKTLIMQLGTLFQQQQEEINEGRILKQLRSSSSWMFKVSKLQCLTNLTDNETRIQEKVCMFHPFLRRFRLDQEKLELKNMKIQLKILGCRPILYLWNHPSSEVREIHFSRVHDGCDLSSLWQWKQRISNFRIMMMLQRMKGRQPPITVMN